MTAIKKNNVPRHAFTLIELLVVIAIIAILAALLLPALSYAKQQALGSHDLNSQKQMAYAWQMYSADASDLLPGNDWGNEAHWLTMPTGYQGLNWISGWESAGDPSSDPSGGGDETNVSLLINPKYAQLGPYIQNAQVYQCAASRILCQEPNGVVAPLVRDISMNVWMGSSTGNATLINSNTPSADDLDAGFVEFSKLSEIHSSSSWTFGPSTALVFIDEKDDSIDDGEFLIQMIDWSSGPEIANVPAAYHAGAGLVGFADGHAEVHAWYSSAVLLPPAIGGVAHWTTRPDNFKDITDGNFKDLGWLQKHATYSTQADALPQTAIKYSSAN